MADHEGTRDVSMMDADHADHEATRDISMMDANNADHEATRDISMMDANDADSCRVLEAASMNDFMHDGGRNPELRDIAVDLLKRGASVIAQNTVPNGTRLTGLRPIRVNAGKAPDAYANLPHFPEDEEDGATTEVKDDNVAMRDGDQEGAMASQNADDGQAEITEPDPNDAGGDQPALPVGQPASRTLEVDVQTIDFNFSTVLPDDVLFQRYNQPYDALWFETLGVDPERLKDWNQNISRWKLVDLVRMGAVKQGDEFEIPVVTFNGEEEDFHVKIVGFGSGADAHIPKIRLPGAGTDNSGSKDLLVKGPVDITEKTIRYSAAKVAQFNATKEGWKMISVWRDDKKIDSLFDMRQKYALWEETVRWFCEVNKLDEPRKRPINRKTGKPFQHPALTLKKR